MVSYPKAHQLLVPPLLQLQIQIYKSQLVHVQVRTSHHCPPEARENPEFSATRVESGKTPVPVGISYNGAKPAAKNAKLPQMACGADQNVQEEIALQENAKRNATE